MRLIEKLMDKAKNRPKLNKKGYVVPWDNTWTCTIHCFKGGKFQQYSKTFTDKKDAVEYGRQEVKEEENLYIVTFSDKREDYDTTQEDREAAAICD